MDAKTHWEKVYTTKEPEAVSWRLTVNVLPVRSARGMFQGAHGTRVDIGAGESTLVDATFLLEGTKISLSLMCPKSLWT